MKRILIAAATLVCALSVQAQDAQPIEIKVDIKSDVHPISPYVYGANDANTISTAIRWGGNRTSAYNWETNASNAGKDYGPHNSDTHLGTETQGPAAPILAMTQTAKTRGQYALVTLQAMGYVAADVNGKVTEAAPSSRWNEVKFRKIDEDGKPLGLSLTPDKADGVVYTEEEINFLINKLGNVGRGGVDGFAIDNEPALWKSTHALAHPASVTKDELLEKTETVALLVKEYAPQAEVYGPMFYGWWDAYKGNGLGSTPSNYTWFVDYYLDEIKALEEKHGKRLVDVLCIHWYPEDKVNGDRIVDLEGKGYDLTTPEMITARLRAPRELWDAQAKKNSGVQGFLDGTPLIQALKKSVDDHYPGTKIGFTEFKYDAEDHFSGGLALVDVLGVFGREGVYMACKWDPLDKKYALAAYNLYRNYDGKGGTFGETSVQAITTHNDTISTVASLDEFGNLHLIVVNKSEEPQKINYALSNGLFVSGKAFGFNAISEKIKELELIETIENNNFTYTVSAYSATHFVLQAADQTQLIHAVIPENDAQSVVLTFDTEITIENEMEVMQQMKLQLADGDLITVTDVEQTENNQLTLTVDYSFEETDVLCVINYTAKSIIGKSELPIHDFENIVIKNQLTAAPVVIYDATVNYNGKTIIVNTSKTINVDDLQIIKNKKQLTPISVEQNSINEYQYLVSVKPRIVKFDTIAVVYGGDTEQATNKGPYESPVIDSIVTQDNFTIYAYSNVALVETDFYTVGFSIQQESGEKVEISSIQYNAKRLVISLKDTLKSGVAYGLHYKDEDLVKSLMGGYLDEIEGQEIANRLLAAPEVVAIKEDGETQIEIENYSFIRTQTIKIEATNDKIGGDLQFSSVRTNNVFGYMVDVPEAGKYTIALRHSNISTSGIMQITVGGEDYELYLPQTAWNYSAIVVELPKGKQMITFTPLTVTPNLNFFTVSKGENPSSAEVTRAQIQRSNKKELVLTYNRLIETLPKPEEIVATIENEALDFTVDYVRETDKTQISLLFAEEICGDLNISYSTTSGRTNNGGILEPYENVIKSTCSSVDINQTPETEIAIYPNPLKAGQKLTITGDATTTYLCTIRTITGAFVAQEQFVGATFVQNLPAGIYMITLSAENYNKTMKLLVQ